MLTMSLLVSYYVVFWCDDQFCSSSTRRPLSRLSQLQPSLMTTFEPGSLVHSLLENVCVHEVSSVAGIIRTK